MLFRVFVWRWGYRHTLRTLLPNSVSAQTGYPIKWEVQRLHKIYVVRKCIQRSLNWPDLNRWLHSWRLQSCWMNAAISSTTRGIANSYRNADSIFTFTHASLSPVLSTSPFPVFLLFCRLPSPFPPHLIHIPYIIHHLPASLFHPSICYLFSIIFPSSSFWSGLSPVSKMSYVCYTKSMHRIPGGRDLGKGSPLALCMCFCCWSWRAVGDGSVDSVSVVSVTVELVYSVYTMF